MRYAYLFLVLPLLASCAPYGDGAYAQREHRKDVERRTRAMRTATEQTKRGEALSGDALVQALGGHVLVHRYESFPGGKAGNYVREDHYLADGRFVQVDNWINKSTEPDAGDYWKVDGARLCILNSRFESVPNCYQVARTAAGDLQFYVDDPEEPYDGLLTTSTREILDEGQVAR